MIRGGEPSGRHRPASLIERASLILRRPMSADERQAMTDAKLVLATHRPSRLFAVYCGACGNALDCPARIEAKTRIERIRGRAEARQ